MRTWSKSMERRALDALASLKLSLSLFLALAATSVVGTVIQQQADPRAYVESYGPKLAGILRALNLVDMYHSWWFELLLALLLANTLVCSLRRLPAALQTIRRDQFQGGTELSRKKFSASWDAEDGVEDGVAEVLSRSFGRPRVRRDGRGVWWFVQKQRWARLGPYVAHGSLVLFLLGGILGARYGFKGFVNIVEGQSVGTVRLQNGTQMKLPFEVACAKFELQTYPDGRPRDYLSQLVVRRNGQVVQEKTIQVNDPLVQDGIHFYQSSYGQFAGGAVLKVFDRDGKLLAAQLRIPQQGSVPIPGTDLSVELAGAEQNLDGFGPAARLVVLDGGAGSRSPLGRPFVVLQKFPNFDKLRRGDQVFQLVRLLPGKAYTGLQVAKDPGVPLIWAGSVLITLGTLMAFFASHRRIWVHLEQGRLTLAGTAAKNQRAFQETFAKLETALRERTQTTRATRRVAG